MFCETWVLKHCIHYPPVRDPLSHTGFLKALRSPSLKKLKNQTNLFNISLIYLSTERRVCVHVCSRVCMHVCVQRGTFQECLAGVGDNSAPCLMSLTILRAEALPAFGLDCLFKDIFTGNSLGDRASSSLWSKG